MQSDKEKKEEQNVFGSKEATPLINKTAQQTFKAKRPWTTKEDEALVALVEKYGPRDWMSICSDLPSRNRKQCRDRFVNHLHQQVKKGSWTQEEDNLIFEWQKKVGNKWSVIAQYLPHRSDNAIKNRYWSALRSRQRRATKEAKKRECNKRNEDSHINQSRRKVKNN